MESYYQQLLKEFHLPLTNPVLVFSLVLFIILLAPIVFKRFNIPGTVGLILSGVFIGPHSLNLLEKSSAVELFSTIGLLYILFIAGLELDVNDFRKNRYKSVLFGALTFAIPIAIGYPVCRYILNYPLSTSLLTASMFATHTLVAYPIASRMGVAKNQAVAITVGGTILTDTAVLIILALIINYSQGSIDQNFWLHLAISFSFFTLIVFLVLPAIARWFFTRLENEKHAHYIFVLAAVFFSAFLAKLAGIEPIVGAFAAGLALNPLIPNASALMNRIEFIGNSLFIPFFLISVGMLVDLRVIMSTPVSLIIAAVLTVVALTGKWVAALLTRKALGYSKAQGQMIFGLSSSHAAATIAIILVGYQARIIDLNILNGTIILILVTCIVASLMTEAASKKLVLEENGEHTDEIKPGETDEQILLPIAEGKPSERVLELAVMIREKRSPNPLTLLSVVPNDQEAELNVKKARKELAAAVNFAASFDTRLNIVATIDYNICSGIGRTVKESQSDLIIFDWPSRQGFIDRMINDATESIVGCTCKTTMICHLTRPLALHRRVVAICPPLSEKEKGFAQWVRKMSRLSQELGIPLLIHCDRKSRLAITEALKTKLSGSPVLYQTFKNFREWEDMPKQKLQFRADDLIAFVSARRESVSYRPFFDHVPERLEKHVPDISKIMIYPAQFNSSSIEEGYGDVIAPKSFPFGSAVIRKIGEDASEFIKKNQLQIRKKLRKKRQRRQDGLENPEKSPKL
ncbi:sodium:proton antiporter [Chlorobaculum limnaeum]|uniref:Sodium:proton antiporter n=1 Tax=Chlorobaculum limnaeum TaxID=274537 RepID=A0A1D8D674_CHLLM|nr:cation:proton antiporter [Chlorobaculum limnaeum]AOS83628.1 sodium:proton antiporter [Chlorobaculum limnaeum]